MLSLSLSLSLCEAKVRQGKVVVVWERSAIGGSGWVAGPRLVAQPIYNRGQASQLPFSLGGQ